MSSGCAVGLNLCLSCLLNCWDAQSKGLYSKLRYILFSLVSVEDCSGNTKRCGSSESEREHHESGSVHSACSHGDVGIHCQDDDDDDDNDDDDDDDAEGYQVEITAAMQASLEGKVLE